MKVYIKIIPDTDSELVFPNFEELKRQGVGRTLRVLAKRLISTGRDRFLGIELDGETQVIINETGKDWKTLEAEGKRSSKKVAPEKKPKLEEALQSQTEIEEKEHLNIGSKRPKKLKKIASSHENSK